MVCLTSVTDPLVPLPQFSFFDNGAEAAEANEAVSVEAPVVELLLLCLGLVFFENISTPRKLSSPIP